MNSSVVKKRGRPSKIEQKQSLVRNDYWGNILTGIGSANSRVNSTRYNPSLRLDQTTLTNIYVSDGIGRRVVNILIDDAMRAFIHGEDELITELQRIRSKQKIIDAATWARLYGGSVLVVFVNDGQDMDRPLNLKTVRKVVSLRSYDRYQITWDTSDLSINYHDEHYGEPEVYTITPLSGIPFKVHRSRLHLFNGERIPERERLRNQYWDQSVLQAVYDALRNYGSTMNASAEIIQDFIQTVLGINGLTDMLRNNEDDLITKRANIIDLTRSVSNTIFLDSEQETYQKQASSVAGLSDLWDRFSEAISATTGIPLTKLLGRSPAGLNSTGKSDSDNWDNIVEAYRTDEIEPCVDWLISILEAQSMWKQSERPENYNWEFPSLKVANESELAKNRLLAAQTDQIYMDRGAVDPNFIFKKRYANGSFETDIFIEEDELEEAQPEDSIGVDPANVDLMTNAAGKTTKKTNVNTDTTIKTEVGVLEAKLFDNIDVMIANVNTVEKLFSDIDLLVEKDNSKIEKVKDSLGKEDFDV
jgi:uncharacterized protein